MYFAKVSRLQASPWQQVSGGSASYALTLCYRACDFSKLSPSPFPLPSREGDLETLSPGGRGEGEGEYESEISHLKLAPMRLRLGTHIFRALPTGKCVSE